MIEERAMATNVHDSQVFDELLGKPKKRAPNVWADSAYRSAEQEQRLKRDGFDSHVHEKAYRDRPLPEAQQRENRHKSRRARTRRTRLSSVTAHPVSAYS